eukprot:1156864-Pelagomonas_calceolata.AAC.8
MRQAEHKLMTFICYMPPATSMLMQPWKHLEGRSTNRQSKQTRCLMRRDGFTTPTWLKVPRPAYTVVADSDVARIMVALEAVATSGLTPRASMRGPLMMPPPTPHTPATTPAALQNRGEAAGLIQGPEQNKNNKRFF